MEVHIATIDGALLQNQQGRRSDDSRGTRFIGIFTRNSQLTTY